MYKQKLAISKNLDIKPKDITNIYLDNTHIYNIRIIKKDEPMYIQFDKYFVDSLIETYGIKYIRKINRIKYFSCPKKEK